MKRNLLQLINPSHFKALIKEGISLDVVYILAFLSEGGSLNDLKTAKEKALVQTAKRRMLITDDKQLTLEGKKIFEFLSSPGDNAEMLKPETHEDGFNLFWFTYPSTDTVVKDGKIVMSGTRSLKAGKQEASELWRQILGEGEYTAQQIIEALKYEVTAKMEESIRLRENKMRYMQNSSTWLRQRTFVQFVELSQMTKQQTPATGAVDI